MPGTDPRLTPMPDARLVEIDAEIDRHHPYSQGLPATELAPMARELYVEVRRLRAREAMLTDTVVTAAAVIFEEIPRGPELDYATEDVHLTAMDLVAANPRLSGAYRGGT